MKRALLALLAVALLGAAGCGDHQLILTVDILSFLTPAETSGHYGPIPGGVTDSLTIAARGIDLLPGINDITSVTDVKITAAAEFANQTGAGTATVKVFVSPEGTDPFTADTTPIVLPVTLAPATTDTVSVTFDSAPGPALAGDFRLVTLSAVVTARQDVVH